MEMGMQSKSAKAASVLYNTINMRFLLIASSVISTNPSLKCLQIESIVD